MASFPSLLFIGQDALGTASKSLSDGLVPVDLDALIESVFIAPLAHDWHKSLIEQIMDKYGLKKPVHKSKLYDKELR
jgi:hypothetical protein